MATAILATVAPIAATFVVGRSMVEQYLPEEVKEYLSSAYRSIFNYLSSELTIGIDEFNGLESNHIYEAAESYLATKFSQLNRRLKARKLEDEKSIKLAVDRGEQIIDMFHGIRFKWYLITKRLPQQDSQARIELRTFEVSFSNKYKDMAVNEYLPYVVDQAKELKEKSRTVKIYTPNLDAVYGGNLANAWTGINLDHPATFETLAMEGDLKKKIMDDLERFVKRKEYYKRVGKAWKRGYLLYGPPGTGKSSLIAAVANFLNFDVYDLDLAGIACNADLRSFMLATENRSILVVEDIDCSINLEHREKGNNAAAAAAAAVAVTFDQGRRKEVTFSGMLNFLDGLWSCCGDERIIIFTTNYMERLDPALLRPGRMDMQIHMSYCTPCGFKTLAANYLEINDHFLFEEIEGLIGTVDVTAAEVAEQLMKSDEPVSALNGLIEFLKKKKMDVKRGQEASQRQQKEERTKKWTKWWRLPKFKRKGCDLSNGSSTDGVNRYTS